MTREQKLLAQINDVITQWQNEGDAQGAAIDVLRALGYTAGVIFSQAPDYESREIGRDHFMRAMKEGVDRVSTRQTLH
jgi:hypothetical protein